MAVSAIVFVDDVSASLAFYEAVLRTRRDHLDDDGSYGELDRVGFAANWHAEHNLDFPFRANASSEDPAGFALYFVVENVDGTFDRAVESGADAVWAPEDKPWGRAAMFRDLDGVLVQLGDA